MKNAENIFQKTRQKNDNGLENAMVQAIKKQAKKKDYSWD